METINETAQQRNLFYAVSDETSRSRIIRDRAGLQTEKPQLESRMQGHQRQMIRAGLFGQPAGSVPHGR